MKIKKLWSSIKEKMKEDKISLCVYVILRILVLITFIRQVIHQNYENMFLCLLTLILLIVPSFLQVQLKIELPTLLEIIILLFIFSAEILGEIESFYLLFPYWDTMLHTINGFLAAAIGFSLVNILNEDSRLQFQLSPLFVVIVAFSFSMTIGVIWEIFEYMMDCLFRLDMQKDTVINVISSVSLNSSLNNTPMIISGINDVFIDGINLNIGGYLDIGLIDTMNDLIVNFIGAFCFSIFGFIYIKNKGKGRIVKMFIPFKNNIKKKESY